MGSLNAVAVMEKTATAEDSPSLRLSGMAFAVIFLECIFNEPAIPKYELKGTGNISYSNFVPVLSSALISLRGS